MGPGVWAVSDDAPKGKRKAEHGAER